MSGPEGRSWLPVGVAISVLALVLAGVVLFRGDPPVCSTPDDAGSPLLSVPGMTEQPDERLDTLTGAVGGWGGPFGEVAAGVGYDYDQWLHLYGVSGGLLAFTKNNAPVTFLRDPDLTAAWSLRPARKRIAWDADSRQFILLGLAKDRPTQLSAYGLADGAEHWCVELPLAQAAGEPVSTAFIADGADLVLALPDEGSAIRGARVSGADGGTSWNRRLTGVDRADFLGMLPDDLFVAGGSEEYRLADPSPELPAREVVSAFSIADGARAWGWEVPAGTVAHVVGIADDHVLVVTRSASGAAAVALDARGREIWRRSLPRFALQATLRAGVLITRTRDGLEAYAAATGEPVWQRDVPRAATYFPYGFTLDQMPPLDADHVLMPTTTALRILDVNTGKDVAYPLPTDGVSTTYWPYQLAVTEHLVGVVTNTGGVLVHRR